MKLLLITQDFPPAVGGIQTYAWELARRMARKVDLEIIAPSHRGASTVDPDAGARVRRVSVRPDLLALPLLRRLPSLVAQSRPDVSFHAQWQTALPALLARRLTGFPRHVAVAAHGRELLFNPFPGPTSGLYDTWRRFVLARADALLPVSTYTAGLLRDLGASEEKIRVVNNGTDPEVFRPVDPSALRRRLGLDGRSVILTVTRLVGRKGVDVVLNALPGVLTKHPDTTYLVIGDGPDRSTLEEQARSTLPDADIRFLGRVPNSALPAYYSLADFAVMPSRNEPPDVEGFGIVFLEANACECAVIGARSGGIPDAVIDGETGLLVPPADASSLSDAMLRLLEEPELRARLATNGRRRVLEEANWDAVSENVLAHLTDLISTRQEN